MPAKSDWIAQSGSQASFLTCPFYECLYEGTRGPGKTDALLMDFAQHCGKGFGANWRGILFRQTYPQLADVVAKSKKWFNQLFPGIKFNASDYVWTWPTGEQLLFRHMRVEDDYWNYHGHEYPWIGFEELTNWASSSCYESMKSCSRSSHPGMPRKYRATANPYGVGHNWVKAMFIDPAPPGVVMRGEGKIEKVRIHGSVYENKILLSADPQYIQKLESITDENKRKAWLEGSWDIVSGGMFDDVWKESFHVIPSFKIPDSWRIDRSFDWGSSKPFSVGWWAESDGTNSPDGKSYPKGTVFRIAEWYGWNGKPNEGCRMLASEIARGILSREKEMNLTGRVKAGPADSSIFDTQNGVCIADDMALIGVRWERADKGPGSRKNGWEYMRKMLKASLTFPMEYPGLFLFDTCRTFIRTIPVLPRSDRDADDIDCFVAGTMVETVHGQMAIESIPIGTMVNTPIGAREVLASYESGLSETVRVTLANGTVLEGTPHHKVFVEGIGLVQLSDLYIGLTLKQKINIIDECKNQSSITASSTTSQRAGSTIRQAAGCLRKVFNHFTDKFGLTQTARYQMDSISTISITTPTTTQLRIWSWWKRANMPNAITPSAWRTVNLVQSWIDGGEAKRGGRHLLTMLERCSQTHPLDDLRALIVECLLSQSIHNNNVVPSYARQLNTMLKTHGLAKCVVSFSLGKRLLTDRQGLVVTSVVGCCERKPVFNLTVRQAHLYFANGVLVTNTDAEDHCADESRYRLNMPKRNVITTELRI